METPLFDDIIIILGLSVAVVFFCHRLRVPVIVGFFLTGVLAGPHGFGLVKGLNEVHILAELGVMLLLFTIGIEFSLNSLVQMRKTVLVGGTLQILLTLCAVCLLFGLAGRNFGETVFLGFLISLSSTAVVFKLLQERAEVESPHGRTVLGILLFQDIAVVPMLLIVPLLGAAAGSLGSAIPGLAAKGVAIVLMVIVGAKWIAPQLLYQVARTRNREIFMLTVVGLCLAIAWLTYRAGLSLALGAFLAGLIISESEYSRQALGGILPFRDVFTSFFFVSIGMLLDLGFLVQNPGGVALMALGVMVLKTATAGAAALALGVPLRTAILVGLAISQMGEFSFILSEAGIEHGLLTENGYQFFLACSILSMAATPFIIAFAPRLADRFGRLPVVARWTRPAPLPETAIESEKQHLVIIGFGVNGKNVARAAGVAGIPYTILEMNPETVRREKAKGEPIAYGDAAHEPVLHHARIGDARVVVVAINDPTATRRVTEAVRKLAPSVHLIVRTRYVTEMKPLYELGADEVIPEEFETSVEIFARVLEKYLIPRDEIEKYVHEVRADGYEMLRSVTKRMGAVSDWKFNLPDVEISVFRIPKDSALAGTSLGDLDLRKRWDVTVLAIRRDSDILSNPSGQTPLHSGDALFVLGPGDKILEVIQAFSPKRS